jgi:hypothetical protein
VHAWLVVARGQLRDCLVLSYTLGIIAMFAFAWLMYFSKASSDADLAAFVSELFR